ncbi:MAG: FAD-linked oxidase C-terminal domain-containing protein [Acidobacteriota bacterium]|nr:FAD-linked oxidase C-terminal domain-containing protein [Acidobacteriota bacterium]
MTDGLSRDLADALDGEVRFDAVSRALYSTDASVYQIEPTGVVIVRHREDIIRTINIARRHGVSITARGGGTSQAGQAIGHGLQLDTGKYFNRVLEVNVEERWARIEPGIVLDELNAQLQPHRLRFAPDISTANRATVGGMISNNSSGARSVLYGKTIDHVLDLHVVLSDGSVAHLRPLAPDELEALCARDTLEGRCARTLCELGARHRTEIDRRFPKILRRVGGYNLDRFLAPSTSFNLAHAVVGSEGTLGVVVEARVNLVPLPNAKAILVLEFEELLDALAATPAILEHHPSAIEVMDRFILDHARESPPLDELRRSVLQGETPGALLCVELYGDTADELPDRLEAIEQDLAARHVTVRTSRAIDPSAQARIWRLRQSSLGLSMAMKGDAKSISFVEDTAVAPERLRDYIARFLDIVHRHGSQTGVYAHASVGCLHVRPVVNLKTEAGVQQFEAIANDIADLVLEFGGALSGEHGDGLVRGPFMERMFGPELYDAFRTIKHTFDPQGVFNPGKIIDTPSLTANLRYGANYKTPAPTGFFDYQDFGGFGRAVEMCSGVGACRKTLDGTMCPSYMVTRDEAHSTRGRANALRFAMTGRLHETGLGDRGVYDTLDLCLECRACKAECPVGVDMARFKSEFLADYHKRHGTPIRARVLGHIHDLSAVMSPIARWVNPWLRAGWVRGLNERLLGVDRRRVLPPWATHTLAHQWRRRRPSPEPTSAVLFNDTFTNYFHPEVGLAVAAICDRADVSVTLGPDACCGRPLISQGLLSEARLQATKTVARLHPFVSRGQPIVVLEPSCLSALQDDLPSLLRGPAQHHAREVAEACVLFEEWLERGIESRSIDIDFLPGPRRLLLHGHCHQKSLGLVPPARALLSRIPETEVVDLDAGCCGMAGSFGYAREHFDVSQQIGERRLLPAARALGFDERLVAAGVSCRHQVHDLAGATAVHPAVLLSELL